MKAEEKYLDTVFSCTIDDLKKEGSKVLECIKENAELGYEYDKNILNILEEDYN